MGWGGKMGREFLDIFEKWANTYDTSLTNDTEYQEVFRHYDYILSEVAKRSFGHVVEFGTGTGNLTKKLIDLGLKVTGIEPSLSMRKLAEDKLGNLAIISDGDFLQFEIDVPPNTFTSTYAFHHLTDEEKEAAISCYSKLLSTGGKIVFADTMFESNESYLKAIQSALDNGYTNLAENLQREYYTTIPKLDKMLAAYKFVSSFNKVNDFVWIMEAVKQ